MTSGAEAADDGLAVPAPTCAGCSDADVGTEVLAIGGNRGEGLGRSLKQQSIDFGLVLVGHRADRGRKSATPC